MNELSVAILHHPSASHRALLLGNHNYSTKASQFTPSSATVIFALIGTISSQAQWKRATEGQGRCHIGEGCNESAISIKWLLWIHYSPSLSPSQSLKVRIDSNNNEVKAVAAPAYHILVSCPFKVLIDSSFTPTTRQRATPLNRYRILLPRLLLANSPLWTSSSREEHVYVRSSCCSLIVTTTFRNIIYMRENTNISFKWPIHFISTATRQHIYYTKYIQVPTSCYKSDERQQDNHGFGCCCFISIFIISTV